MNDKKQSFGGIEKPRRSTAEVLPEFDETEPYNPKISILSCLTTIFREQPKMRTLFLVGCIACVATGAVYPGKAVVFAKSVSVLSQDGTELVRNGTFWALLWFILAVDVCLNFLVFGTIFAVTGSIIMRIYRHEYFSSMIEQDMLFFAAASNSSAALTTSLLSHTQQLEPLLSKIIGSVLIVLVNVISSCALSIAIAWKLRLIAVFGVFPLISLTGFLQVSLSFKSQSRYAHHNDQVLCFASECVACIRTISSLTLEAEISGEFEI